MQAGETLLYQKFTDLLGFGQKIFSAMKFVFDDKRKKLDLNRYK